MSANHNGKKRGTRLTNRELATVLAALRYWQNDLDEGPPITEYFSREITPLTEEEIDELCDRLNVMKGH